MRNINIVFLFFVLGTSSAFLFDWFRPKVWNSLKVKWGINLFKSFNTMPRTEKEALKKGFKKVGDCCDLPTHKGTRFVKDNDEGVVLLYDKNGFIAGIQMVIPENVGINYSLKGNAYIKVGDEYYVTAYFVDPATICSTGRSTEEFKMEGTGTMLLIQNGENPVSDYVIIPTKESNLSGTKWVEGHCFKTMGNHYWYDLKKDMSCDDVFPVFLLYNKGKLNGFGWAVVADLKSKYMEHPTAKAASNFMEEVPTCLSKKGTIISTMHIYLTSTPLLNWC